MMRRVTMLFMLATVLLAIPIWACGPFYMRNYLVLEDGNPLIMPEMSFSSEMKCLLDFPTNPHQDPDGKLVSDWDLLGKITQMRERSMKIDLNDFYSVSYTDSGVQDKQVLNSQYADMRKAMLAWVTTLDQKREQERIKKQGWGEVKEVPDVAFDLAQHEELLNKIPKEFSEYVRGAYAYHRGEMDTAIKHFDAVLQLSAEQRKHRSTWAAFMLGKIYIQKDPAQAYKYFEQVRTLTKEGYHNPLNLAGESLAWQARIDGDSARYVDAIHHYAECAQERIPATTVILSLKWVCNKILSIPTADPAVVNDPLCREVLTAAIASHENTKQNDWLAALEKTIGQGVVAGSERLAWLAYQRGDMQSAQKWLKHCEPHSVHAKWVQAKLLLRNGKLEEGAALLGEVSQEAKNTPDWAVKISDSIPVRDYASAEMGAVLLGKRNYAGALDAFLRAGYLPDAAYVAERLISVDGKDGLEQYLINHTEKDPDLAVKVERWPDKPVNRLVYLRDVLARRLARQGEWEKAAKYYTRPHTVSFSEEEMEAQEQLDNKEETDTQEQPDNPDNKEGTDTQEQPENAQGMNAQVRPASEFSDEARMIAARLKIADDTTQTARARAQALFDAAKTLRKDGLELTGTELTPDWASEGGGFSWERGISKRLVQEYGVLNKGIGVSELNRGYEGSGVVSEIYDYNQSQKSFLALRVTDDEVARRMASAAVPYKRYHYRYVAADMMWRCAQMLPNNDPLCAEALYLGGTYLQNRDPLSADKFYKALVRRNPNFAIAQEAIKLKWFPPKFTDEVLYHSPVQHIRKRTLAMWGCGGLGLLALAGLLIYKRSRKGAASVQEDAQ